MADTMHATAVSVSGAGVLLVGRPGSGKSDLAFRLIDRGALLIADDRVLLSAEGGRLILSAPPAIAGLLEVRGVGLQRMAHANRVNAAALFDLEAVPDRLPEPATRSICGINLPIFALSPFEASAPLKLELTVAVLLQRR